MIAVCFLNTCFIPAIQRLEDCYCCKMFLSVFNRHVASNVVAKWGIATNGMNSTLLLNNNSKPLYSQCKEVHHDRWHNGFGWDFGRRFDKYDTENGKREYDPAVPERFYRLHWGPWIHSNQWQNFDYWRKNYKIHRRARQHSFCSAERSYLLDKMTTKYWTKRKYYVDDIYEPYHERDEYLFSRRKPLPASLPPTTGDQINSN